MTHSQTGQATAVEDLYFTSEELESMPKPDLARLVLGSLRCEAFKPRLDAAFGGPVSDDPLAFLVAIAASDEPTRLRYSYWASGVEDVIDARRLTVYGRGDVLGGMTAFPGGTPMASLLFTSPRNEEEVEVVKRALNAIFRAAMKDV